MPIWGRRQAKPGPGVRIDWSYPLSQGLLGFYTISEGSGLKLYDAASMSPVLPALNFGSASPWSSGPQGIGLNCVGAGEGASVTVPAALQVSLPVTVAVGFRMSAMPNSTVQIASLLTDNSTNGRIWSLELNTTPTIFADYNGAANTLFGPSINLNTDYVFSGSCQSGLQALYLNGVLQATATTAFSAAWTATSQFCLGPAQGFFNSRTLNGLIYWGAWWNRFLAAVEHALIAANPWRMLLPPRAWWLDAHPISSAPVPSFIDPTRAAILPEAQVYDIDPTRASILH